MKDIKKTADFLLEIFNRRCASFPVKFHVRVSDVDEDVIVLHARRTDTGHVLMALFDPENMPSWASQINDLVSKIKENERTES